MNIGLLGYVVCFLISCTRTTRGPNGIPNWLRCSSDMRLSSTMEICSRLNTCKTKIVSILTPTCIAKPHINKMTVTQSIQKHVQCVFRVRGWVFTEEIRQFDVAASTNILRRRPFRLQIRFALSNGGMS